MTPSRPPTPIRRAWLRRGIVARLGVVAAVIAALLPLGSAPVGAQSGSSPIYIVEGRGWGHGRGMGQFGALGYAQTHGWSYEQILAHYYSNTSAGTADPGALRVDLRGQHGKNLVLRLGTGAFAVNGNAVNSDGKALSISYHEGQFHQAVGDSCVGPWAESTPLGADAVTIASQTPGTGLDQLLQVCQADGSTIAYQGTMELLSIDGTAAGLRTVNTVNVEAYLRGVIPFEVSGSWPVEALKAQAVAARSYISAGDARWPYADSCDSTLCQVYRGEYQRGSRPAGAANTDAAIAATAHQVRRMNSNGAIARTEYSSSTGGFTAGGVFPAVRDLGDAVASNPNRTWRQEISAASIEAKYPNRGALLSIVVTQRNGHDPFGDGGRVSRLELRFSGGTVQLSGEQARTALGVKSDWFSVTGATEAALVRAGYQAYFGRTPTPDEAQYWQGELMRGTSVFSFTNAMAHTPTFAGAMIDDLYERALGRSADPGGRAYWLERVISGRAHYADIGTYFYGGPEYYHRSGGTPSAFVTALYRDLLGRSPDASGLQYWVSRMERHGANYDDVAYGFYSSVESRTARADAVFRRILGRPGDPGGLGFGAERIAAVGDLVFAAELGTTAEFRAKALAN